MSLNENRKNIQTLDLVFAESPMMMVLLEYPGFRFERANDQYMRFLGRNDIIGKHIVEVLPELESQGFTALLNQVASTGVPYKGSEIPFIKKDKDSEKTYYYDYTYQPLKSDDGKVYAIAGFAYDVTEKVLARKAAENAAKAIEIERQNFRNLFKLTPEMVCILSGPEHRFEFVNEAHVKALGFDATGKTVREAQPESVEVYSLLDKVYQTGQTAQLHEIPVTLTDRVRYFNLTYSARFDGAGAINGVMVLGVEVTEEVQNREQLIENKERLDLALSSSKMGTWTVSLPSEKVVLSDEAQRIFGFDKSYQNADQAIDHFIHPEDRSQARRALTHAIATKSLYDDIYRVVRPDGETRWINARGRAKYDSHGAPTLLIGVILDITERKQTEEALNYQSNLTRTITDNAASCLFMMDRMGHPTFMNPAAEKLTGYRLDEIKDKPLHYAVHNKKPDGSFYPMEECPIDNAQSTLKALQNQEEIFVDKNGRLFPVSYSVSPLEKNGETIGSVLEFRDISEQKRAETDLRLAKEEAERANSLKSAFLANMSHEIRTPLGAMIGFADLLRDPGLSETEKINFVDILVRNGNQLAVIINDILDLSKVEAGHLTLEFTNISPDQIAADVVSLLRVKAKEKDLALDYFSDSSTPEMIVSDLTRVRQILLNIVANAIKFTQYGSIKIKSSGCKTDDGRNAICFEVSDTGIGIHPSQTDRVFEMFVQADGSMTRRFGGTGLGLALSRRLARALGGDVSIIRTEEGVGSTFLIKIEDQPGRKNTTTDVLREEKRIHNEPDGQTLKGVRVLVVDDAPDNQQLLWRYLTRQGALVETAENGLVGYRAALAGSYDIILMDIQMPIMDGYTATQKLRESGYIKPIIALSAHGMNEVRKKTLKVGCDDHLVKPINANELIHTVAKHSKH